MIRILIFILVLGVNLSCIIPSTYIFSGTITYTQDYCGGAAPPQELLDNLRTPKPFAKKRIYFKKGKVNGLNKTRIGYFTTDSLGKFQIKLSAHVYVFFDESKLVWQEDYDISPDVNKTIDYKCLLERHMKGDFTIYKSQKNLRNFTYNYHTGCFYNQPCIEYHGPYPPSVAPKQETPEPSK